MDVDITDDPLDFEDDVQRLLPASGAADTVPGGRAYGAKVDPRHRTVVCRHWLHGLCQKGERCEFLHMFDRARMTPCKHGLKCKIKNCCLKHVDEAEKAECIFFKQGFCRHGPSCRFRHIKRPPDSCPEEADFSLGVSPLYGTGEAPSGAQDGRKPKPPAPNQFYKIIMCKHWLNSETGECPYEDGCHYAHGEAELRPYPGADDLEDREEPATTTIPDPSRGIMLDRLQPMPFNKGESMAYFMLQAPDILALYYARERGVWSVPVYLADVMNHKFNKNDHVLIFFSLPICSGLYGLARMQGLIPQTPPDSPVTPEFKVRWLRSCRVPFTLLSHLKVGNSSLARSEEDVELGMNEGQELLYVAYRKPEWRWGLRDQHQEPGEERKQGEEDDINPHDNPSIRQVLFPPEWVIRSESLLASRAFGQNRGETRGRSGHFLNADMTSFVFSVTQYSIKECFAKGVFGAIPDMLEQAEKTIHPGTPLFLANTTDKVILGIFQATSEVAMDLDPTAFARPGSSSSPFPVQVRFSCILEAPPLMEGDPILNDVFPGGKLRIGPLQPRQTHTLADAFADRKKMLENPGGMQMMPPGSMNENDPGGSASVGQRGYYKPPHHMFRTVWLGMESTRAYNVPRSVLGPGARNVKSIMEEADNAVRIRLRGMDSGFKEGPEQAEVREPIHFIVSSDDPQQLDIALAKVHALLERIHHEYEQANSRGHRGRGPPPGFMPPPQMMMRHPMGMPPPGEMMMMPPPFFDGPGMHPMHGGPPPFDGPGRGARGGGGGPPQGYDQWDDRRDRRSHDRGRSASSSSRSDRRY